MPASARILHVRERPGGVGASGAHVNLAVRSSRAKLEAECDRRGLPHHWRDWQSPSKCGSTKTS